MRAKLTMEKVYLALETVGLTAEKTKLENDCREGASELKITDVSVTYTHGGRGACEQTSTLLLC